MEDTDKTTPFVPPSCSPLPLPLPNGEGRQRGVGGKFRKPPARKPPATPYDRPLARKRQAAGWLSKLVDPACRLITSGATKIFPSFFSKSPSDAAAAASPPSDTTDQDKTETEFEMNACKEDKCSLDFGGSRVTGASGPSKVVEDGMRRNSDCREVEEDKINGINDESEFRRIEQLMSGKSFTRDEINRLTEILNSRIVEGSNIGLEKKKLSMTAGEGERFILEQGHQGISSDKKQEVAHGMRLETSMPLPELDMQNDVRASPIDIAKAYMGSKASETGLGSYPVTPKVEIAADQDVGLEFKSFITSPSTRPSTCWPGAMPQDQRGYLTPRTQKVGIGLHSFPRTPYSRTAFSIPKAKPFQLEADSCRPHISSTSMRQSQTPTYGKLNSWSGLSKDTVGSVGPIRRIRNKYASEVLYRKPVVYTLDKARPQKDKYNEGFEPTVKNSEPCKATGSYSNYAPSAFAQDSEGGTSVSYPSASLAAKKILEHLDRHKPTPKEKEAELKLATTWNKSPLEFAGTLQRENTGIVGKNIRVVDQISSADANDDRGISKDKGKLQEIGTDKASDAVNRFAAAGPVCNTNGEPSSNTTNIFDPHIMISRENTLAAPNIREEHRGHLWPYITQVNGQDLIKTVQDAAGSEASKRLPHSSGTRPNLPSISISKPDPQRFSADNGFGFTFPISASASILSEPPTPSVMPSLPVASLPQLEEGSPVPTYNFGTKKSTRRLVFSFPSTSNTPIQDDASDLKFNFGSGTKSRISFSSLGKDAVCY